MNDKQAQAEAEKIRNEFWKDFEQALAPKRASKKAYLEELGELVSDANMRIECVRAELKDEDEDDGDED